MIKRIFFLIIVFGLVSGFSGLAEASWLTGYDYRKEFSISNSNIDDLTNYQLMLNVHKGSGTDSGHSVYLSSVKDDFSDIRFTNAAGAELDYWIEKKTDGNNAAVWIELDFLSLSSTTDFYLYYSNDSTSSASSGADTFILFDDFERGSNGDPIGGDWIINTGSAVISNDHPYSGDYCAKLAGASERAEIWNPLAYSDDIAIQYRSYKEAYSDYVTVFQGNGTNRLNVTITGRDIIINFLHDTGDTGQNINYNDWELLEYSNFDWTNLTYDIGYADSGDSAPVVYSEAWMDDYLSYDGLLVFRNNGDDGTEDYYIDDLIVRNWTANEPTWESWGNEEEGVIPEPASFLLLGMGILGIAGISRKNNKIK